MERHEEKRKALRTTTVVEVKCKIMGTRASAHSSYQAPVGTEFSAKTINFSQEGILINSETDLTAGTQLEITLSAPTDGHPIQVQAEVAWTRRNAMNFFGRFAAGLRIRKITDTDRELLTNIFKDASTTS